MLQSFNVCSRYAFLNRSHNATASGRFGIFKPTNENHSCLATRHLFRESEPLLYRRYGVLVSHLIDHR